jgi:hypothetical protein
MPYLYYTLRLERGRPPPSPCPRSSPRPRRLPPCNPAPPSRRRPFPPSCPRPRRPFPASRGSLHSLTVPPSRPPAKSMEGRDPRPTPDLPLPISTSRGRLPWSLGTYARFTPPPPDLPLPISPWKTDLHRVDAPLSPHPHIPASCCAATRSLPTIASRHRAGSWSGTSGNRRRSSREAAAVDAHSLRKTMRTSNLTPASDSPLWSVHNQWECHRAPVAREPVAPPLGSSSPRVWLQGSSPPLSTPLESTALEKQQQ